MYVHVGVHTCRCAIYIHADSRLLIHEFYHCVTHLLRMFPSSIVVQAVLIWLACVHLSVTDAISTLPISIYLPPTCKIMCIASGVLGTSVAPPILLNVVVSLFQRLEIIHAI